MWYGNQKNRESKGQKRGKTLQTVSEGSSGLTGSQKVPAQLTWHPHLVGLPQPHVKGWFPQSLDGLLGQHVLQAEKRCEQGVPAMGMLLACPWGSQASIHEGFIHISQGESR